MIVQLSITIKISETTKTTSDFYRNCKQNTDMIILILLVFGTLSDSGEGEVYDFFSSGTSGQGPLIGKKEVDRK